MLLMQHNEVVGVVVELLVMLVGVLGVILVLVGVLLGDWFDGGLVL